MADRYSQFIVRASWGAGLALVLGWGCAFLPWGEGLIRASYDMLQFFPTEPAPTGLDVVTLPDPSDRSMHAALIDYLGKDGARLVVSDIFLAEVGDAAQDERLAAAIRENRRVLLAGEYRLWPRAEDVSRAQSNPPRPQFATNALGWGLAAVELDGDGVVRWIWPGTVLKESLPWAAASHWGQADLSRLTDTRHARRAWLRYYGPPQTIPHYDASEVTNQVRGRFKGHVVFLGAAKPTGNAGEIKDTFATSYTHRTGNWAAGAEILATSFLNIVNQHWIRRMPRPLEGALYLVGGLVLAGLFGGLRGWHLVWVLPLATIAIIVSALVLCWHFDLWFGWAVVVLVQLPAALAGAYLAPRTGRSQMHQDLKLVPLDGNVIITGQAPLIPDHELLELIGTGGYGQVWLARNRVGLLHAVKIVYRQRFDSDRPYEREFQGIERFMPVSRLHRGFVHVLHVGRDDARGFFFYIMEAGDDERTGSELRAEEYRPATLARRIEQRGRLPGAEVLVLMTELCEAVRFLHEQGLVHRDIKPSNVIYVRGVPKLADVGLVAPVARRRKEASLVGTAGFLLCEAAGTVEADLYALGKVLYVSVTGLEPASFPEVPTADGGREDENLATELIEIAWRACAIEGGAGYSSAVQMSSDLIALRQRYPEPPVAKGLATD